MRLLKKINNNYALALDSQGIQIIVEGKGIGFQKMPCELTDLSLIKRTYYDTKDQDIELIKSVSEEVLALCKKVVEYANEIIGDKMNPNLTFILADHIQFAIDRFNQNIQMKMPIYHEIEFLYPKEIMVADYAMRLILEDLSILLPDGEKTGIALNIINSELITDSSDSNHDYVELCTSIVEKTMNIKINRQSFNYSRFVTHLEYLFRKSKGKSVYATDNKKLYETVSKDYPEVRKCVDVIERVLNKKQFNMNEEEKLYLMLHVNRLCSREDCY